MAQMAQIVVVVEMAWCEMKVAVAPPKKQEEKQEKKKGVCCDSRLEASRDVIQ